MDLPDPQVTAKEGGLRYVEDGEAGFTRVRWGRGFRYRNGKADWVEDPALIERFKELAIPPAWEEVWICRDARGHLQATGVDEKRRKQYLYHERWTELRNRAKFESLPAFGEALPKIRRRVLADIREPGLGRSKIVACVVRLLDESLIRVGNPEYAEQNKSYGLTTLRAKHVEVHGGEIEFAFAGKSGKTFETTIDDPKAAAVVAECHELPGQRLFQYVDDEGEPHHVTSCQVNDYLLELTGEPYTSKDFRTWGGTVAAAGHLEHLGPPRDESSGARISDAELKRREVAAVKAAAELLNNTPATCRTYYVHPGVIDAYADGRLEKAFAHARKHRTPSELRLAERALLRLAESL